MSFSGGVYTLPGPALSTGEIVSATENNQFRNDVATAFNLTFLRNGTSTATANLPMGGYKLTGLGAATTSGDALSYGAAANVTTITISSDATLSGGTANGVAYLNGSKVLTTGSALTFDGALLDVGVGNTYGTINAKRYGGAPYATVTLTDPSNAANEVGVYFRANGTNPVGLSTAGAPMAFYLGGPGVSEQMRLTSTGLGIGTSSPSYKLDVVGTTRFSQSVDFGGGQVNTSGSGAYKAANFGAASGAYNVLYTGTTSLNINNSTDTAGLLTLTNSGNLGLGVTPSAWVSNFKAIQLPGGTLNSYDTTNLNVIYNAYYDGGWKYKTTNYASFFAQEAGQHRWFTAPSGTAGNAITFTQAMTLDASGNLGVGTTTLNPVGWTKDVTINSTGNASYSISYGDAARAYFYAGNSLAGIGSYANIPFAFVTNNTERMRIDSSGNVGIGVTPSAWSGGFRALEIAAGNAFYTNGSQASISSNLYNNGSGWLYKANGAGGLATNVGGTFTWYTAASGTAGASASVVQSLQFAKGQTLALEGASTQAGVGITFPATQSASSDANTLDDYEEGTWTPVIAGSTSGSKTPAGNNAGWYVKIGKMVYVGATVDWSGGSSIVGNVEVTGLPFACGTGRSGGSAGTNAGLTITSGYWLVTSIDPGNTFSYLVANQPNATYNVQPTVATTGTLYGFALTYTTS